jgi:hypothetical protein
MDSFGKFLGNVVTVWHTPDREMRLLRKFGYRDPTSNLWLAPAGSIIDGASIPRLLWTLVGSPFTGDYRKASVVHDVACTERNRPWEAVHRMFYFACRCGGVGEVRAKIMFAAVFHFGPRWSASNAVSKETEDEYSTPAVHQTSTSRSAASQTILLARPSLTEQDLAALTRYIEKNEPSVNDIETLTLADLARL